MNIELLRKVQASILDPANPFDMVNWNCCIAGHLFRAAKGAFPDFNCIMRATDFGSEVAALAGIPAFIAEGLFCGPNDRLHAVQRLQWLIEEEQRTADQPQPPCSGLDTVAPGQPRSALEPTGFTAQCSALEPRSRSARAEDQNRQQDRQEEPELVEA